MKKNNPREITFRGKPKDNPTGNWIYGSLLYIDQEPAIVSYDIKSEEEIKPVYIVPETLQQDTGCEDLNGTAIYEGDIVEKFSCYLSYQQVGNYPPPNIEVEEWSIKRSVYEVEYSYGSFNVDGFPIMFGQHSEDYDDYDDIDERRWFNALFEDNANGVADKYPWLTFNHTRNYVVIGNIIDNPELLDNSEEIF